MSKAQCSNCKFYWSEQEFRENVLKESECRRYPPQRIQKHEIGISSGNACDSYVHPYVLSNFWCGEWRPVNGA